jgi:hypothetical protein
MPTHDTRAKQSWLAAAVWGAFPSGRSGRGLFLPIPVGMSGRAEDQYFVEIRETLAGRRAGAGAAEMARQARAAHPLESLVARALGQHTDERAWRKGARGEVFAGWLLDRLPEGWHVFNDIPVGARGANIDHLVLGPGGVFTVNTKNLTGKALIGTRTFLVNGHKMDYLPKAAAEARRASRLLGDALGRSVEVRGTLALIVNELTVKEMPPDVYVNSARGVKRWMLDRPPVLSARQVLEIAGVAHKPETWKPSLPAASSPGALRVKGQGVHAGSPCPCGGIVVERTRRADGVLFLGCSRFPKCRRTWPG